MSTPRHQKWWVLDHCIREHGMTYQETADFLGVSQTTVGAWAKRHGIKRPTPWRDADTLADMYWGDFMTIPEIADHFGVSTSTISEQMKGGGVPTFPNDGRARAARRLQKELGGTCHIPDRYYSV